MGGSGCVVGGVGGGGGVMGEEDEVVVVVGRGQGAARRARRCVLKCGPDAGQEYARGMSRAV